MSSQPLGRRKFNELSAAAVGGLVAGTLAGCGPQAGPNKPATPAGTPLSEKHLCRGLNDCKGKGASGKNDCRGQGDCATVAHHDCGTSNECKGQGGCGEKPALNDCKGKGGCHVPLMPSAWKTVRERKEAAWASAKEKFGEAPPKPE